MSGAPDPRSPVPEAHEAAAKRLEKVAADLREIGRHGRRALGEGEHVYDALWGLSDELGKVETEIDRLAAEAADEADR